MGKREFETLLVKGVLIRFDTGREIKISKVIKETIMVPIINGCRIEQIKFIYSGKIENGYKVYLQKK